MLRIESGASNMISTHFPMEPKCQPHRGFYTVSSVEFGHEGLYELKRKYHGAFVKSRRGVENRAKNGKYGGIQVSQNRTHNVGFSKEKNV